MSPAESEPGDLSSYRISKTATQGRRVLTVRRAPHSPPRQAEVREEARQGLLDEIRDELESAVNAANESDAPDIGTEGAWGKDEAAGLNSWLELFNRTW